MLDHEVVTMVNGRCTDRGCDRDSNDFFEDDFGAKVLKSVPFQPHKFN